MLTPHIICQDMNESYTMMKYGVSHNEQARNVRREREIDQGCLNAIIE